MTVPCSEAHGSSGAVGRRYELEPGCLGTTDEQLLPQSGCRHTRLSKKKQHNNYICIDSAGWACGAEPWVKLSGAVADLSWAKSLAGGYLCPWQLSWLQQSWPCSKAEQEAARSPPWGAGECSCPFGPRQQRGYGSACSPGGTEQCQMLGAMPAWGTLGWSSVVVGRCRRSLNSPCAVHVTNPALSPGRARCNNRLRMSLAAWMPQTNLEYSQTWGYGN